MPTAVILTALAVELQAARSHLTEVEEKTHAGTIYLSGTFSDGGRTWNVALAQIGMGGERTAVETQKAITRFCPEIVVFLGVAGGLKDVTLGDVVAASKIYAYEYGKAEEQFRSRPEVHNTTHSVVQRAQIVAGDNVWQRRILPEQTEPLPTAFVGAIAAGSKVIASERSPAYVLVKSAFSDALAVEMEGHGFLAASHANGDLNALVVRGISDLIEGKGEADAAGGQARAASHAAAFAYEFLSTHAVANDRANRPTSALETASRFFEPFIDTSKIFSHGYPLVGREHIVDEIAQFPSASHRIAILSGRGGIGKSRVLREALMQIAASSQSPTIRMLADLQSFEGPMLNELAASELLLVVDDAHKMSGDDLRSLLSAIRQRENSKILITTRPNGLPAIQRAILDTRFSLESILELPELTAMSRGEMVYLASLVLGNEFAHLADRLVDLTGDSPLVTVVAARLLALRQVDPAKLLESPEAHFEIFGRFTDVLLGNLSDQIAPSSARSTLELLAAIGPLQTAYPQLLDRSSEFLGDERDQFLRRLSLLADAGALLQVGSSYSLTPDLLSRHLLRTAALMDDGRSTGFAERVFERVGDVGIENLLNNLSEVSSEIPMELIGKIVEGDDFIGREPTFEELFRGAPPNPIRSIGRILGKLCENTIHRRKAIEYLWLLGRDDARSANQNSDHPIRVLQSVAELQLEKATQVYEDVLVACERWLFEDDAFNHRFSPLDVLSELLKKDVSFVRLHGEQLLWNQYPVSSAVFGSFRRQAIRLLRRLSNSDQKPVQLIALRSLLDTLWTPSELASVSRNAQERRARTRETELILGEVQSLLGRTNSKTLACVVREKLLGMVLRSHDAEEAVSYRAVLNTTSEDFDLLLTRYVWHGWSQRRFIDSNLPWDKMQKMIESEVDDLVKELVRREGEVEGIKSKVEAELRELEEFGITDANPGFILQAIGRLFPELGIELGSLIVEDAKSPLSAYLHTILIPIWNSNSTAVRNVIAASVRTDDSNLQASIALLLGNVGPLETTERNVISGLSRVDNISVRLFAIRAIANFPASAMDEIDNIVASLNIGQSPELADAVADLYGKLARNGVTVQQWHLLLEKLIPIAEIQMGSSPVGTQIKGLITSHPMLAVEFFI